VALNFLRYQIVEASFFGRQGRGVDRVEEQFVILLIASLRKCFDISNLKALFAGLHPFDVTDRHADHFRNASQRP